MPAAVNRLTAAGKAAHRRKATICRDFPAAADRFARRGKPKTAAADKHFVVVYNTVNIRRRWEVASSSSGMADVGACYIVDAQRHVRGFTVLVW